MTKSTKPTKGPIIVFGILFWFPLAGVTYQFLHFLIGLRRLGYDPYYIEDSGRWIYDPKLNDLSPDATNNLSAVVPVLEAHGFRDRWAFRGNYPGGRCYGLTEEKILRLYRKADAFLNVTGAQELREALQGGLQNRAFGGVADAHRSFAALTEGRAGREAHARLFEQAAAEGEGIAQAVDARE